LLLFHPISVIVFPSLPKEESQAQKEEEEEENRQVVPLSLHCLVSLPLMYFVVFCFLLSVIPTKISKVISKRERVERASERKREERKR
jgi:hypothetical protein